MAITLAPGEIRELSVQMQPIYVPPEPATLYGVVTDASTGFGIGGATVALVGYKSTTTSSNGAYQISDIEPGTYTVRFSHPDYETVEV